ncbi:hypothetical protein E4U21_007365 [Claviceps maximensis]|nr:hypothetical protein E4U21_007365 [Claviceps maximensis]
MPPTTRKRTAALAESSHADAGPESSAAAPAKTNTSAPAKRQKKMPVRSMENKAAAGAAPEENATPLAANVVRFDDEGNADKELIVPAGTSTAPALAVTSEDAEGSDSDEAPEAVSTSRVAKEMMESAQMVKKLAQEQAVAAKKKRQQRDALFKKQALERKDTNPADEESLLTVAGRKRADKTHVPHVLPAEFLADSSSEDEDERDASTRSSEVVATRRPRTVPSVERRLARQGKGPRDEVIGSTVYRISMDVDASMAPKAKKLSQNSKNALLRRGRQPVQAKGSGFFKR